VQPDYETPNTDDTGVVDKRNRERIAPPRRHHNNASSGRAYLPTLLLQSGQACAQGGRASGASASDRLDRRRPF